MGIDVTIVQLSERRQGEIYSKRFEGGIPLCENVSGNAVSRSSGNEGERLLGSSYLFLLARNIFPNLSEFLFCFYPISHFFKK